MASDTDRLLEALREIATLIRSIRDDGIKLTVTQVAEPAVHTKLDTIINQGVVMAGELQKLTEEVAEIKGKSASLIALVQGLAQYIRDNLSNGPALLALANDLDAQSAVIQAAIDANPLPGEGGGGSTAVALPAGTVGVAYSTALAQPTGPAPFSFAVTVGALPDGLALDSSNGVLAGTPTTAGDSAFSVQVGNADGPVEVRAYTLTIA